MHEAYPGHHVQMLKVYENPRKLRHYVRESIFSYSWLESRISQLTQR